MSVRHRALARKIEDLISKVDDIEKKIDDIKTDGSIRVETV